MILEVLGGQRGRCDTALSCSGAIFLVDVEISLGVQCRNILILNLAWHVEILLLEVVDCRLSSNGCLSVHLGKVIVHLGLSMHLSRLDCCLIQIKFLQIRRK